MQVEPAQAPVSAPFSGSYHPNDVTFLLRPVALAPTDVGEKERLIRAGRHYSEMIAPEHPPEDTYLALYRAALQRNGARLARDVATLAARIAGRAKGREIVLASLARAGTPIGVLLLRTLRAQGHRVAHYSLSIIRDRGIDLAALGHIATRHDPADVVFVDGWTGKGAIAAELERSLAARPFGFAPVLAVIADPAGHASLAAGFDDYLIPSGLLNAIVSGLVSRSILSAETVAPGQFHACVFYSHLAGHDLSRDFVETIARLAAAARPAPPCESSSDRTAARAACAALMAAVMRELRVGDPNRIKPGIAEATRALLRRVPDRLLLRDAGDPDVRHLVHLAAKVDVPIGSLPPSSHFRAVAVIDGGGDR